MTGAKKVKAWFAERTLRVFPGTGHVVQGYYYGAGVEKVTVIDNCTPMDGDCSETFNRDINAILIISRPGGVGALPDLSRCDSYYYLGTG